MKYFLYIIIVCLFFAGCKKDFFERDYLLGFWEEIIIDPDLPCVSYLEFTDDDYTEYRKCGDNMNIMVATTPYFFDGRNISVDTKPGVLFLNEAEKMDIIVLTPTLLKVLKNYKNLFSKVFCIQR